MESGTSGPKSIESLRRHEQNARGRNTKTDPIQITNKPHQITVLEVRRPLSVFVLVKYVEELILELGGRRIEAVESLEDGL